MTGNEYLSSRAIAYFGHWLMVMFTTLVVWWLHQYVPFIPDMHFGQCLALVLVVGGLAAPKVLPLLRTSGDARAAGSAVPAADRRGPLEVSAIVVEMPNPPDDRLTTAGHYRSVEGTCQEPQATRRSRSTCKTVAETSMECHAASYWSN